jgi:hypothetical protein
MFVSKPSVIKGKTFPNLHAEKTFFRANSDSECSACPSGLSAYNIQYCSLSPSASRCQLAPSDPSPVAHELILAAAALPVAAWEWRRRRHPRTAPTAVASPYRCPRPPSYVCTLPLVPLHFSSASASVTAAARGRV